MDRFDVVLVVQGVHQPHDRRRVGAAHLDDGLRLHRQLGGLDLHASLVDRLADGGQVLRGADHLERIALLDHVLGARVDCWNQVVLGVAIGIDHDHASLFEHPGHRARLSETAAVLVERVAHVGARSVAVVRERLDENSHARGPGALVDDAVDGVSVSAAASAAIERALARVPGHREVARLLDRRGERAVGLGLSPTRLRCERDRAGQPGEALAAVRSLTESYATNWPVCWNGAPSTAMRPPCRKSQTKSEWTALSYLPPRSG